MIDISETVPLPSEVSRKKQNAQRVINKTIKRYQDAYRAIYGKIPTITYNDPWVTIESQRSRVSVKRLLDMAKQLEARMP